MNRKLKQYDYIKVNLSEHGGRCEFDVIVLNENVQKKAKLLVVRKTHEESFIGMQMVVPSRMVTVLKFYDKSNLLYIIGSSCEAVRETVEKCLRSK